MKLTKWLISAFAAVLSFALLFSWLPRLASNEGRESQEVVIYKLAPAARLTSSNIVDVFISIPWNENVRSVKWNGSVLTVVFKAEGLTGKPESWLADVDKLLRTSFIQLDNVNRLLIRFVDGGGPFNGERMLAAIDVRKTDSWLHEQFESLGDADLLRDETWRKRLRLSFAPAWDERFGVDSLLERSKPEQ